MSNFGNPFSFRGKSGRLDYLVYGVLLSYSLMIIGFYIGVMAENIAMVFVFVIVGAIIALASTVRRVRDRKENIILVILLSLIPYLGFIVMLFLLLAPGIKDEQSMEVDRKVEEDDMKLVTVGIK